MGAGTAFAAPKVDLGFASGMIGDKGPNAAKIPILLTNTDTETVTQTDQNGNALQVVVPLDISAIGINIQYDSSLLEFYSAEAFDKQNKKADANVTDPGDPITSKLANVRIAITGGQVLLPYSPTPVIIGYVNFNIKESASTGFTTLVNLPDQASKPDAIKVDLLKGDDGSLEITDSNPIGGPLTTNVVGGTGLSSITVNPLGFSNDPTIYNLGNKVILTAVPEDKYRFKNWTGDCSGTENPFTLIMTEGTKSCTANFELDVYKISLKTNPLSSGSTGSSLGTFTLAPVADTTTSGTNNYTVYSYSPPTLSAVSSIVGVTLGNLPTDYAFKQWSGQCGTGTNPSINVSLADKLDKTCAAILNAKVTKVASGGTITGSDWVDASSSVAQTYTITPATGYAFSSLKVNGATVTPTTTTPTITYRFASGIKVPTAIEAVFVVSRQSPIITWANPTAITYGAALDATQLNATADVAGSFVYTPAAGAILDAGSQTLKVDFTPTDATAYNTATKTVTIIVNKADPVITWSDPAAITYGATLGATQLNATASTTGSFAYTPASGTQPNAGTQPLKVDFTPTSANYNTATKTVSIIVNKATPVITWTNPGTIYTGTPLSSTQLNAIADVAGSFVYTPATGTILAAGSHNLKADFTPSGSNYNTATKSVTILVNDKQTPIITWANPTAITYGAPLTATQLNATADVAGSFVYTPATGAILDAGSQTLKVDFTPTDATAYNTATKTVTIIVNKADPIITWSDPAAITYGATLGATQLNATASTTLPVTESVGLFVMASPAGV